MNTSQTTPKIKIRNKRTGEVRDINLDESLNYGITAPDALEIYKSQKQLAQTVQTGNIPQEEKPLSAEASRLSGSVQTGLSAVSALENILDPNKEQPGLEGRNKLILEKIPFALGARDIRNEITNLSDIIGRLRSGAAITGDEEARFRNLLPRVNDDDKTIQRKIDQLKNELSAVASSAGITTPPIDTDIKTSPQKGRGFAGGIVSAGKGIKDFLFSSTENVIRDVVQTPLAKKQNEATNKLIQSGEQLLSLSEKEQDPVRKQQLIKQAQNIFTEAGQLTGDVQKGFSSQAEENPLTRGLEVGLELGTAAEAPSLIKGLSKKAPAAVSTTKKAVKNIYPSVRVASASSVRSAIAKETKHIFNGNKIIQAGKEYVKNDPTAKKILKTVSTSLKNKKIGAEQALKKLEVWNKAYTSAGKVGKSGKAGLYRSLADALREEMKNKTPELLKAQKALGGALEYQSKLGGIFSPYNIGRSLGTGITGGVTYGLANAALKKLGIF